MLLRVNLPSLALALLAFFLFVSVSEAAECNPCSVKTAAASPCSGETASVSPGFPGDRGESSSPSSHSEENNSCSVCSFCLSPCIGSSTMTVAIDDGTQRLGPMEYGTIYEAPSFSFLRPPRS